MPSSTDVIEQERDYVGRDCATQNDVDRNEVNYAEPRGIIQKMHPSCFLCVRRIAVLKNVMEAHSGRNGPRFRL